MEFAEGENPGTLLNVTEVQTSAISLCSYFFFYACCLYFYQYVLCMLYMQHLLLIRYFRLDYLSMIFFNAKKI